MSLDLLRPFYDACHDTVVGLRTGQSGMANNGLARFTRLLTELIDRMPAKDQTAALPIVNEMLAARSNNDTATLADLIQYKLAKALLRTEIVPQLLNPEVIIALRGEDRSTEDALSIDHLTARLRATSQQFSQAQGLSVYHAAPLLARNAHADAKALLDLEHPSAFKAPAVAYLSSLTLAHEGNHAKAVALMEDAYARCPTLRDGFVRIGQIKSAQGDHKGGLTIATQDASAKRMTPPWQINFALLHGQTGDFPRATTLIADAYQKQTSIKNGFARLGWILAMQRQWPEAQGLMDRDYHDNKMSASLQAHFALIRAHVGEWEGALRLIESAYALDPAQRNAYARLGWHSFLLGKGIRTFRELVDKDLQAERFSPAGGHYAALCHAVHGDFARASSSVERYCHEFRNAQNQWAGIGWAAFKQGNPTLACELMLRDYRTGHLSRAWMPSMALLMAYTDNKSLADKLVGSMARSTTAKDSITIGYHFAPDRILSFGDYCTALQDRSLIQVAMRWNFTAETRLS